MHTTQLGKLVILAVILSGWYSAIWAAGIPAPPGLVAIPAGPFTMGDSFREGASDELPTHSVVVNAFYMDQYEVTKAQWDHVYLWATNHNYRFDNTGFGKATNHPVHSVSWHDCVKWCNARSEQEGLTPCYYTTDAQTNVYRADNLDLSVECVNWSANGYRLPTEAEWEKAARGGAAGHRFPWSDAETIAHQRANYYSDAAFAFDVSPTRGYHPTYATGNMPYTSPVGAFPANGYGLYDMTGNVWEWCWDWLSTKWYSEAGASQDNPRGPAQGTYRIFRGGSWGYYPSSYCRTASRVCYRAVRGYHDVGFRCVRTVKEP